MSSHRQRRNWLFALTGCAAICCAPLAAQEHHDAGDAAHAAAHAAGTAHGHDDAVEAGHDDAAAHAEGGAHHPDTTKPPLTPQPPLMIVTLVIFGVFLLVSRKVAWLPLLAGLNAREARIAEAQHAMEHAHKHMESVLQAYESRMATARDQVKAIVSAARSEAEQAQAKILADARADAQRRHQQALADVAAARDRALNEIGGRVDEYAGLAVEHIVGRRGG